MKVIIGSILAATASATTLKLTWSDCGGGKTHAPITGFTPATLDTGKTTTMTGTGNLDEDVASANFDLEMKTALTTVSCKGDASVSKTCSLPLATGSLTFEPLTFPIKKGPIPVSVTIKLSAALPGALAKTDTTVKATGPNGEALFCVEIKTAPALEVHPERAAQIAEIQATEGVLWKAEANPRFAQFPPGASKSLNGVIGDWNKDVEEAVARGEIERFVGVAEADIPESFDSADNWPNCAKIIGDIRDQSNCGCCWAFAGAEAASDRMCISSKGATMVPLSAQDVCFNGGGFMSQGCNGGQITSPWSFMKKGGLFGGSGVVSGGQYQGSGPFGKGFCADFSMPHCHHHGPQGDDPYPAENKPGCPHQASAPKFSKCNGNATAPHNDFKSDKYSYNGKTITANGVANIQQAIMAGGPMEVAFTVYEDFENYAGGIYHHVSGGMAGGHAVKVVGWGVEGGVKYWKIANSWNPYWGEKGYFRIKFGEGGVDNQAVASDPAAKWSRAGDVSVVV